MTSSIIKYVAATFVGAAIGIAAVDSFGQESTSKGKTTRDRDNYSSFCSNDGWSSDHVSLRDLREMNLPATGSLTVDAGQNGGISVRGEERNDVRLRACVQAWGMTETEARTRLSQITLNTSGTIKAESSVSDRNWSVSFQLLVPRSTNLQLNANNGGISILGVNGTANFETMNGGVHLKDLSGDVHGRTTNGGIHVVLSGRTWSGSGLDVTTTNGGVHLSMPANYAAHFETATVNGGFSSSIAGLNVDRDERREHGWKPVKISTDLNGGGPTIRVVTTNGGVKIAEGD